MVISFCVLIGCCLAARGVRVYWKDGNYQVYERPVSEQIILGYSIGDGGILGLSDATVVAAGSDGKFVVFKRDSGRGLFEYYYIEKRSEEPGEVVGPLSEAEFTKARGSLALPVFSWSLAP
jgi:hypothetical protein